MKRKILTVISLTLTVGLFVIFSSCNSGSKSRSVSDTKEFNPEVYKEQLQGVWAYLPPYQGMSAMLDNHFIFVFGDSDTSMFCQSGTFITSGDTVIYTTQYSSNPELVGTSIKWSAHFLDNDSVKTIIYDDERNIINELYNIRKAKVDENTVSQMKKFEGSYKYVSGYGGGIILSGYMVYITQSNGGAGTYIEKNDTVTFKRLFSADPELIGAETTWVNESRNGDTLNWATINDAGKVKSRGQSVYLK